MGLLMNERDLFMAALQIEDAAERAAYVKGACAGDAKLRLRVDALLGAFEQAGSFLQHPVTDPPAMSAALPPGPSSSSDPAEGPGTVIGPYKLHEQIGEGGFGVVFRAEQQEPIRRKVAVKIVKPGMDSRQIVARFDAERQALALMDHPNIAKVLDAGTTESGRPFFVMEFVKGIPFTKHCDDSRLSVEERLALFMPVCHAVQHAHQKGIIHRDLKPSNILVCLYDGVPIPKVIDFGLAKAMYQPLTEHTLHTAQGLMMGTPLYMSPEQAELNNLDVDTRTDVYSLGVMLYELLTGTTPLERKQLKEAAWHEMLRLIKEEEPPKPSMRLSGSGTLPSVAAQRKLEPAKLTKLVRGDLDWIVMKALEKEPGRRYETANGLARDLQNYLADEPVEATPPSASYRLRKFSRKHKKALVTVAAFAVLLVAGAVLSTLLAVWAMAAEGEAVEARIDADAVARAAEANLYVARMNLAQTDWENANVGRILELLEPYRQLRAGKPDLRGWEWYYQDRLCQLELRTIKGHAAPEGGRAVVGGVAFSPDGSRLASGSADRTIKIWDAASGQELRTLTGHTHEVWSVVFSPDGSRLASASYDRTIKVWDTANGRELLKLKGHTKGLTSVAFRPHGRLLASASYDGTIKIWDTANGQELRTLQGHTGAATSVAFSPDGGRLASGSGDETIKIWDTASGEGLRTLRGHTSQVSSVAFSPGGSRLASAGADQTIKIWDTASGQELHTLKGHTGQVSTVAFSPDGSRLASAGGDQTIKVWDTARGQMLRTLTGHAGAVVSVAFSPDGSRLASGADDRTIKVWDTASGEQLHTLKGHTLKVGSVAFSPDGSRLASGGSDRMIKVWDVASGQELLKLKAHTGRVLSVAFSPDGSRLASAGDDRTIKVWDTASGQELRTLKGHTGWVSSVAFSPDGSRLASGSDDQTAHVFDARPWTPELRRQREALGLLEYLCEKLPSNKEKVAERIRADKGITEDVRREALDLLEVYWPRRVRAEQARD
jgi:WD40 repeat protein/serine/threonine protein kinase